jgi:hypothetical protein
MKAKAHRIITIGMLLCALGLVISVAGLVPSGYAAPSSPTVGTVALSLANVCSDTATETASATITAGTYDADSGPIITKNNTSILRTFFERKGVHK